MKLTSAAVAVLAVATQQVCAAPVARDTRAEKRAVGIEAVKALLYGDEYLQKRGVQASVITSNFPDPSIMLADDGWYAFATRTPNQGIHVPVAHSTDFQSWRLVSNADGSQLDAMPSIPAWAGNPVGNYWGPDVSHLDDNSWIMYFSASLASNPATHCVGAARSTGGVQGPYTSMSDSPLICPESQGGAIDPSGFQDPSVVGGSRYIAYKVDGNSLGHGGQCGNQVAPIVSTPIMLQEVAADGVSLVGGPTQLLDNDGASDDGIVEAPSLLRGQDGQFYLFFSSGCFLTDRYTVSYAVSPTLTGGYQRKGALFQADSNGMTRPGGADVFRDGSHLVFHNGPQGARQLYTAEITANNGEVTF